MKQLTKVLLVTSEFPPQPGGIGFHAHHVAQSLVEKDYGVTVLTDQRSSTGSEERLFDKTKPYNIIRVKRNNILVITYLKRIVTSIKLLKQHDKIIVSGKFSIWIGGLQSLFTQKKIIAVVHGSELFKRPPLKKKFTQWCLRRVSSTIAVSNYTKSLISDWGVSNIVVIPNGHSMVDSFPEETRPEHKIRLITVGNVTERKGQHNVIKALPKILEKFPDCTYDIVGIPTEKSKVLRLAEKLGVRGSVTFHGIVSEAEKIRLLKRATMFLMLSQATKSGDVEGFGIAILEANALGKPAIGSRGCGIEDAIAQGRSGILVKHNAPDEVAMAVSDIIHNYERYREETLQWARNFTWDIVIQKYIAVLES